MQNFSIVYPHRTKDGMQNTSVYILHAQNAINNFASFLMSTYTHISVFKPKVQLERNYRGLEGASFS